MKYCSRKCIGYTEPQNELLSQDLTRKLMSVKALVKPSNTEFNADKFVIYFLNRTR